MIGLLLNDQILDEKRLIADPPADEVIAQLIAQDGRAAAKAFFDQLIREIELPVAKLPAVVQAFIEKERYLPEWIDRAKIKQAQALFIDHGPKFLIFLYYKSLPILYSCAKGATVLVQTGRLAHQQQTDQFTRRIAETGQFLLDVMAPGSLLENEQAIDAALKVRLIHAAIRSFIPTNHWDENTLGKPINQEDLAITLMTFSIATLDGLDQFGLPESDERKSAYLHYWNIIGHFLGIEQSLLPASLDQARALLDKILERQSVASEGGQVLTKALLDFGRINMPSTILKETPEALMRFMIGPKLSSILGIEPPSGCASMIIPEVIRKFFGYGEHVEDKSGVFQPLIHALSKEMTLRMVHYFDRYKNRNFTIPESLRLHWFDQKIANG